MSAIENADYSASTPYDYFVLMKPRLMSLVVFTGIVGAFVAPGYLHPVLQTISIIAVAMGAGAAGTLNMWYERDIDAKMPRTKNRPIPAGRISPGNALAFGMILTVSSVTILGFASNYLAAFLLAFTIAFYLFVYTIWLKRRTAQNIIIGGACGAIPPMIGWAAVTGSLSIEPFLLFTIIFIWQAPHFWALSLFQKEGYANADVPMLPVTEGAFVTRKQIVLYTILMNVSVFLPLYFGMFGWIYGITTFALTLYFNERVWRVWKNEDIKEAKSLFWFSIAYLFLLFLSMFVDHGILS